MSSRDATTTKIYPRPAVAVYRAAAATVRAFADKVTPTLAARSLFGNDPVVDLILRAASSPASVSNSSWAGVLAQQAIDDFVAGITALSAAAGLISRGMRISLDGLASVRVPLRTFDTAAAGSWVAEGGAIRVRNLNVGAGATLYPRKMAVITAFTGEVAQSSNVEAVARAAVSEAASQVLDQTMFDANPDNGVRPAGLLSGVAPLTATTGTGQAALEGDIKLLYGALAAKGAGMAPVLVAAIQQAGSLKVMAGPKFDVPVLASGALAAGTVVMLEPASFVSGFDSVPEFDTVAGAAVHFEDTAPGDISGSVPVKSLFQDDLVGLRMILKGGWAMRAPHIAWLQNVTW
jgi:hypothetical protein